MPVLAHAQAAFWDSIRQLYARALAGSDGDLLAKTAAGLLHPGTSGAPKAAGMSVDEAATGVGEMLAPRVRGQTTMKLLCDLWDRLNTPPRVGQARSDLV